MTELNKERLEGIRLAKDYLIEVLGKGKETYTLQEIIATLDECYSSLSADFENDVHEEVFTQAEYDALVEVAKTSCPYEACPVNYNLEIIGDYYCAGCWKKFLVNKKKKLKEKGE